MEMAELNTDTVFQQSGECDDEVTLKFDEGKVLFVSRNFLRYASPVFAAMFKHDFKETNQNSVQLPGKDFEKFHEFLLCIHPGIMKPITEENMLWIAVIAEEYQVLSIKAKCMECMRAWLLQYVKQATSCRNYRDHVKSLKHCLGILSTTEQLDYDDVSSLGVQTVARFAHELYDRNQLENQQGQPEKERIRRDSIPLLAIRRSLPASDDDYIRSSSASDDDDMNVNDRDQLKEECMKRFEQLSANTKYRILSSRLKYWKNTRLQHN